MQIQIVIHPYKGIEIPGKGHIVFGMIREQVRAFFDETPEEVWRSEDCSTPEDHYQESTLSFSYDDLNALQSIMIVEPQDPVFQGQHLLQAPYKTLIDYFLKIDPNSKIEDHFGLTSSKFGIHLHAPEFPEEEADYSPESILVYSELYY